MVEYNTKKSTKVHKPILTTVASVLTESYCKNLLSLDLKNDSVQIIPKAKHALLILIKSFRNSWVFLIVVN